MRFTPGDESPVIKSHPRNRNKLCSHLLVKSTDLLAATDAKGES